MAQDINAQEPLLEIKEGNEVFRVHRNEMGIFLVFGAESGGKSNLYEMNISTEQADNIKQALS